MVYVDGAVPRPASRPTGGDDGGQPSAPPRLDAPFAPQGAPRADNPIPHVGVFVVAFLSVDDVLVVFFAFWMERSKYLFFVC